MADGKLIPVGGQFNWEMGVGYQRPSPKPGGGPMVEIPPGWNEAPHASNPGILNEPFPEVGGQPQVQPIPREVDIRTNAPAPEPPARVNIPASIEWVDLAEAEASFMGHRVALDSDSIAAIKMILGQAICENLRKEQQRVLDSVQDGPLPGNRERRAPHVLALPQTEIPLEPAEPGPREVLGLREPEADPGPEAVPVVPRRKARSARARTARRRVPRQDDGSVPPA